MNAENIGFIKQGFAVHEACTGRSRVVVREVLAPCNHAHAKCHTDLCHGAADVPEPQQAERSAMQIGANVPLPATACMEATSSGKCRAAARISAQVNSGVAVPSPSVPRTVIPAACAAARSTAAFHEPLLAMSCKLGGCRMSSASKRVRSRMTQTMSNGFSR